MISDPNRKISFLFLQIFSLVASLGPSVIKPLLVAHKFATVAQHSVKPFPAVCNSRPFGLITYSI